ncbi:hypothetical protein [Bradyrhizobium sp. AZCC 2289]|jgi:hypothetical protein|uniref:hypothetical protein n=1 Tax=Bradyrhizobium sp. AZCC 2289 TaxID=3117026 RepID=UPI002FEFCEA5
MGWMQDRDLLIAETLAFVKGVKGANAETTVPVQIAPIEEIEQIVQPEQPGSFDPPKFERMSPLPPRNEREEITARLASFKATQLRFQREREDYSSMTLRDALHAAGAPQPSNVRSDQVK